MRKQAIEVHWLPRAVWELHYATCGLGLMGVAAFCVWAFFLSSWHPISSIMAMCMACVEYGVLVMITQSVADSCMPSVPADKLAIAHGPNGQTDIVQVIKVVNPWTLRVERMGSRITDTLITECPLQHVFTPGLEDADQLSAFQARWEQHYTDAIHIAVEKGVDTYLLDRNPLPSQEQYAGIITAHAEEIARMVRRDRIKLIKDHARKAVEESVNSITDPHCMSLHVDLSDLDHRPLEQEFTRWWEAACRHRRRNMGQRRYFNDINWSVRVCADAVTLLEKKRTRWTGNRDLPPVYNDLSRHFQAQVEKDLCLMMEVLDRTEPRMLAHVMPILHDNTTPPTK